MGLSPACWMAVPFCAPASGHMFSVSAYFLEIRRKQPIKTLMLNLVIRAGNESLYFVSKMSHLLFYQEVFLSEIEHSNFGS